ncbi:hypothetical protein [Nonomuraea rubra]|uniref:hypothetical protein n=1 Tax=Nonomuraea rubra TaxID=46180 RepID=UPI0033E0069C
MIGPHVSTGPSWGEPGACLSKAVQHHRATAETAVASLTMRLHDGQRLCAEHLYEGLHAHLSRSWWRRLAQYGEQHLGIARAMAKFSFWVGSYLTHDSPAITPKDAASEKALALAHLDYALALIRCAAARDFLHLAEKAAEDAGLLSKAEAAPETEQGA